MHNTLKLLETKYWEQDNRKKDEDCCVSQLWQWAQQGTHLFPDGCAGLHTAERSDDSQYPEWLEVDFDGHYLKEAKFFKRSF